VASTLLILLSLISSPPAVIVHGADTVSVEEMLDILDSVQVIFVGESHDDPQAHSWELFLWKSLASQNRSLALEMFEVDVQDLLNGYLSGEISLEEFLEDGRPWGNYIEDYHPMVEFAAENGFSVTAANVPRYLASSVAREGWEGLAGIESADYFLSMTVDSSNSGYRERFLETMAMVGDEMHQMPMDPMNIYRAQLFKDAVMAGSIKGMRTLFVCGSFHSDYRSGIPDQLDPLTTFLTVKIVSLNEDWRPGQADFMVFPLER